MVLGRRLQNRFNPRLAAATNATKPRGTRPLTTLPPQRRLQRQPNSPDARRRIVTSSIAPPITATERPETIVIAESKLYASSWHDSFASSFPERGLHFSSVDITKPLPSMNVSNKRNNCGDCLTLSALESNLGKDLSNLHGSEGLQSSTTSSSAHALLVARGPIPCLISQYFLESLPLAGLVLIDPLLLPEDGRRIHNKYKNNDTDANNTHGKGSERWYNSLKDIIDLLEGRPPAKMNSSPVTLKGQETTTANNTPNEITKDSLQNPEVNLLHSLVRQIENPATTTTATAEEPRPLRLEPGSIPILIFYSNHTLYSDYYRICAERTAAFHTACGGSGGDYFDQVSVLGIPKKTKAMDLLNNEGAAIPNICSADDFRYKLDGCDDDVEDDLDWVVDRIYEWYDEVVA
mmetsp:Transcript_29946/g.64146  ORF Transcript_29946/g.64146 Transcript_29946/m.64146 type:complete len:406 (+) Transcript_29946:62-1279(+)